jgi:hypothetical protein
VIRSQLNIEYTFQGDPRTGRVWLTQISASLPGDHPDIDNETLVDGFCAEVQEPRRPAAPAAALCEIASLDERRTLKAILKTCSADASWRDAADWRRRNDVIIRGRVAKLVSIEGAANEEYCRPAKRRGANPARRASRTALRTRARTSAQPDD